MEIDVFQDYVSVLGVRSESPIQQVVDEQAENHRAIIVLIPKNPLSAERLDEFEHASKKLYRGIGISKVGSPTVEKPQLARNIITKQTTMTYDPLDEVRDEPLSIDGNVLRGLANFRSSPKFVDLPGVDTTLERERLSKVLNDLSDTLIRDVAANPSKRWVMGQFQRALALVTTEDTEGREHFGIELERLMDILGIESSDGLLSYYLGGL